MSSLKRILAARANGARSRGPKTPEGKRRSSSNAVRHGLLADCVLLPGESRANFNKLVDQYLERFGPLDGVEFGMVEEMAASYWRLRRAWAIENGLMTDAVAAQPEGDDLARIVASFRQLASSQELALLHRYESRLHNMFHRAMHNLLLLRVAEPRAPQSDPDLDSPMLPPPQPVPRKLPNARITKRTQDVIDSKREEKLPPQFPAPWIAEIPPETDT